MQQGAKNKVPVFGTAVLNLAEFATKTEENEFELQIPLAVSGCTAEHRLSLHVCFIFCIIREPPSCGVRFTA